jgi:hypothetical protein
MATISLEITLPDDDFDKALSFLNNDPGIIEQVKKDYFPKELIKIDTGTIADPQIRFYHTNGIVAAIINLTNAQHK